MEITVRARARGFRDPDYATLVLVASTDGAHAQQCLEATSALVVRIQDDLDQTRAAHPGAVRRVVVSAVSTRSWRPWNDQGAQLPLRHSASSRVEVEVGDHALLGQVSRRWGATEGVVVHSPDWHLDEATRAELVAEVTTAAVRQARARAQVMAEASGFKHVQPLHVADTGLLGNNSEGQPADADRAMAMSAGGDQTDEIDLPPRPLRVEVVVEARFATE